MANPSDKMKRLSAQDQDDWTGNAPASTQNGGRWTVDPDQQSKAGSSKATGFAVVSVKLRPAEKAVFQEICKEIGVTPNRAMRSMVRQVGGFLEVDVEALEELRFITRQISGIATNINQIAKAGNRTLSPDYVAFMEDRRALGKELARLERMIQHILNVGRRRTDGLKRLKQLVEAS